jgi:pimeloyl-ACP methyl ester carboxylesterase
MVPPSSGIGVAGSANVESASAGMIPKSVFWLDSRIPNAMPSWIAQNDIDFYSNEFKRSGFRGGLNWYRNIDRNWELLAPWAGAKVTIPALYVAGDRDLVVRFPGADKLIANLGQFVPQLQDKILLPDCGHWTQQERPEEINAAVIRFLKELD